MHVLLVVGLLAVPALVCCVLDLRARRVRRAAWAALPVQPSGTAVRGYKVAQLVVDDRRERATLLGLTGRSYAVDVVAQCGRARCVPPGLGCSCGFYAFGDRAQALALMEQLSGRHPDRGYVLLVVDLDGAVLEYEHGYRAARQRVHRIELPRTCSVCRSDGVRRAADVLVTDPVPQARQVIAPVRAVCAAHQPSAGARRTDLGALRGLVGTEVDRMDLVAGT